MLKLANKKNVPPQSLPWRVEGVVECQSEDLVTFRGQLM